jgi:GH25 family lysozyme M1 (1,4-beta-N-acetylmuramidase)
MRTLGVDASHWEGDIDWVKATPTLGFAYYKATDGTSFIDSQLGNNMDECNETGLAHAPFHWWQERQDPEVQAEHFVEATRDGGYKRYIVDVEPATTYIGIADSLKHLLDRIEALVGVKPAIYTSANYWNNYIIPHPSWAGQYDLLVAHYTLARNPTLPIGWSTWKVWQFTDKFWAQGCTSEIDANWFNGPIEQARAWFGNYHPFVPPQPGGLTLMRTLVEGLRIRSAPTTRAPILGSLRANEVLEVIDVGGTDSWIRHARGWSAVETGGTRYMEPVE